MPFEKKVQPFGEGVEFALPGLHLVIPEVPLGILEKLDADVKALGNDQLSAEERLEASYKVVLAALQLHYPEATIEDVKQTFGARQLLRATRAALGLPEIELTPNGAVVSSGPTKSPLEAGK